VPGCREDHGCCAHSLEGQIDIQHLHLILAAKSCHQSEHVPLGMYYFYFCYLSDYWTVFGEPEKNGEWFLCFFLPKAGFEVKPNQKLRAL
jgi:hypothetical protein